MITVKPPQRIRGIYRDKIGIFLAGSIEMGNAEEWQSSIEAKLEAAIDLLGYRPKSWNPMNPPYMDFVLLNPRRDDWDSSWQQKYEDPHFYQQVEWELTALKEADHIIMYFDPGTKSPISLLELGLYAASSKMVVVCPEGFYRKGNVDIVCDQYNVVQKNTLQEACDYIIELEIRKSNIYED